MKASWTPELRDKFRKLRLGNPLKPETKEKLSQIFSGSGNNNFGKTASPETKEKQRAAKKGRRLTPEHRAKIGQSLRGSRSSFWRGGGFVDKYSGDFSPALKEQIRSRDGFACFICGVGESGQAHDVHHIDYNKNNNDKSNLITLCRPCHVRTNVRREHWLMYFGKQ